MKNIKSYIFVYYFFSYKSIYSSSCKNTVFAIKYSDMKKNILKNVFIFFVSILFFSCSSTPKNQANSKNIENPTSESQIEESNDEKNLLSPAESDFLFITENMKILVENAPKETSVNKNFSSAFVFKILDSNENPIPNFSVKINYPIKSDERVDVFSKTDENGIFSFESPTPLFGLDDKILFSPYIDSQNEQIKSVIEKNTISVPYKVKNNFGKTGVLLFVWDFNEKNKPVNNSYDLLSSLRAQKITMSGNAPVNEVSYYNESLSKIYKDNYEIVGNAYGYLIVGTVKFTKPVEQSGSEYLCSLISDINVIKMQTGEVVFQNTFTNEALGKNWTKCVTKCKQELADKIVNSILYSDKF